MSLSRPVKFPLLKLPFLCIECVIKSWDTFDIIFIALISKRTRQIVKHLKIPLSRIGIFVTDRTWIEFGEKSWHIKSTSLLEYFREHQISNKDLLVLQNNANPLYTRKTDSSLESYFNGNEVTAVKTAMEFLKEVFKCSVETVNIHSDNLPESGDIGVKSTVNLNVYSDSKSQKLNLLLEHLEVTGTFTFWMDFTEKGFYVDPKRFKCKTLIFYDSAAWVTREILLQFEVPRLKFYHCRFSVEDILTFITNWFHSDNEKLEYLFIIIIRNEQISLENFRTKELNPIPFSGRTRVPLSESLEFVDFSEGLEIVRHDGLKATIHVKGGYFLFYIWHEQLACTQS